MGVTTNGERDILGIWAGDGGEGARFWLQVFTELKNCGVEDVSSPSATASKASRRQSTPPGSRQSSSKPALNAHPITFAGRFERTHSLMKPPDLTHRLSDSPAHSADVDVGVT